MQHLRGKLEYNHALARYTSWRVGGRARQVYWPIDRHDLSQFLSQLPANEPLLWLGLGSNTLVRDGGFDGTVIVTQGGLQTLKTVPGGVFSEAGVSCAKLAKWTAAQGWQGAEFFAGIPGTVGGALRMNAGAFGTETWQRVSRLTVMDHQGRLQERSPQAYQVGYRDVQGPAGEWFIGASFALTEGDATVARRQIRSLLKERNEKQPIGVFSCGSVFRNPLGDYAGRLIETSGLKGHCLGGAQVSEKHANFIINTGKATALEIEALIAKIQSTVFVHHRVALEPEVKIIGKTA